MSLSTTDIKPSDLKPRSEGLADFENAILPATENVAARKVGAGISHGVPKLGDKIWAPKLVAPATAVVLAGLSQWDHHMENLRWKHLFEAELASKTGKPVEALKIKDFEKVGNENPVLHEALARSRAKRNISVAAVVFGTIAATAISAVPAVAGFATGLGTMLASHSIISGAIAGTAWMAGAIGLGALTAPVIGIFLAGAAISGAAFFAVETLTEKVGAKKFGLDEPSMSNVEHHPEKQAQMSVPNQVAFLTRKQNRREAITKEQVMQVFASANPVLAAEIESRFGEPFHKLSAATKDRVLEKIGPQYNIEELTNDLNNRHIRAQELAFAVAGQQSGVPRLESGDLKKLQAAYQNPKAHHHASGSRLAFLHSKISGIIPGMQKQQAAAPAEQNVAMDAAPKAMGTFDPVAEATKTVLVRAAEPMDWRNRIDAERTQQAAVGAGIV